MSAPEYLLPSPGVTGPPIGLNFCANSYQAWALALEDKGRGIDGSSFEFAKQTITKDLVMAKSDCNVDANSAYSEIKFFFSWDRTYHIQRMKKGPDRKSMLTLQQFFDAAVIEKLLENRAIVDSMEYYDKPLPG